MAAAYVLASTDCWTRSADGLSTTRCLLNAPIELSLQCRLSLVAHAWVVQTSQQHVCYAIIHQLFEFKSTHHCCCCFHLLLFFLSYFPARSLAVLMGGV